jgi:glycerophosphodiester phosphodiesterase
MKFGRNLPQFTVPEWSAHYIKYKALKKLIKSAAEQIKAGQEADLAGKRDVLSITKLPCNPESTF